MAKLSARGRQEVVRLEKHTETPLDPHWIWSRYTWVLASDGRRLVKITRQWRGASRPDRGSWKDAGSWGPTAPKAARQWVAKLEAEGYTLTRGLACDMLFADQKDVTPELEILQAT